MSENQPVSKSSAVLNSLWKILESFGSKGISMIVTIVLARLLDPASYGVISLTAVFTNLSDILIQGGFSTALIRKEKINKEDYSTVLCISLTCSVVLYAVLFFCAPAISVFYEKPVLKDVLRVLGLVLFCQAFAAVRTAVISREMKFKTLFVCTIISNIVSGIIGIVLAYSGAGVWALVWQQLSQQVLLSVLLYLVVKIKVSFKVSRKSVSEILPFSLKVLCSSLLSFAGDSLYSVAIGKVYSLEDLGFYDKGGQFPRQFSLYTFSAVSNVFLPIFSSYKNDYAKLNEVFRRVVNVSCYIIIPLMAGLGMAAEPFISLLLTDKWLPCVGILRWSCLYYAATPLLLANVQLHFAIGKGETRIKTEVIRIILMVVAFVILMWVKASILWIAACLAFIQLIISCIIFYETKKATGYQLMDTVKDILSSLFASFIMCVAIYGVSLIGIKSNLLLLVCEVFVAAIVYFGISIVFHIKAFDEVKGMAKSLKRKVS